MELSDLWGWTQSVSDFIGNVLGSDDRLQSTSYWIITGLGWGALIIGFALQTKLWTNGDMPFLSKMGVLVAWPFASYILHKKIF